MRKPGARLVGANYRAFEKRYCSDEWPDHLPEREPDAPPAMEIIARRQHCIQFMGLNGVTKADPEYSGIVRAFGKGVRSMIPEHVRRRDEASD